VRAARAADRVANGEPRSSAARAADAQDTPPDACDPRGVGLADAAADTPPPVSPDPKPERRHKASKKERERISLAMRYATCVGCGLPDRIHLHHVAFRGADGGDDILENICPLCLTCHDRFHARAARWELVAAAVRKYVMDRESRYRYVRKTMGQEKFDRRYPALPMRALGENQMFPTARLREEAD